MIKIHHIAIFLACVACVSADAHPDNTLFEQGIDLNQVHKKTRFGRRVGNHKKVDETKLTNSQDNFGRAKRSFIHAIEDVEKKAIKLAENMIHDEVDVLFGKDHGHHEDDKEVKTVSTVNDPIKSRSPPLVPAVERKKKEIPHSLFLDFMESYAADSYSHFGY
ncbi:predicted protein [Chaetoceros tenuissimus]|uniref:Uncharacterized protein n=1 Tax=Chaetoceros tenuissimus TaxID=426638 RepID=A0AAD3CKF3_9STRA|nr:predicted protein [Chaetoceros tenuissimus]